MLATYSTIPRAGDELDVLVVGTVAWRRLVILGLRRSQLPVCCARGEQVECIIILVGQFRDQLSLVYNAVRLVVVRQLLLCLCWDN